jgi:hypothetical protein
MTYIYTLLISISALFIHDYHFGYTEVLYNKDNKSIETSIKVFTDDLNKGIEEEYGIDLKLNDALEMSNSNEIIQKYLLKNLSFNINNKIREYNYIGKEYEGDAIWIYVEVSKVKKIKEFQLKNSLLFDTYDDQKHRINIDLNNDIRSATLEKGYSTFKLKL